MVDEYGAIVSLKNLETQNVIDVVLITEIEAYGADWYLVTSPPLDKNATDPADQPAAFTFIGDGYEQTAFRVWLSAEEWVRV